MNGGALVSDEARGITSVTYDNLGNPSHVSFGEPGGYASYVYSATGERLMATHFWAPIFQSGVADANHLTDSERTADSDNGRSGSDNGRIAGNAPPTNVDLGFADIAGMTRLEYHGPVVYHNGKVEMVRFPGGYATIKDGEVTFHYYTQDYLGNNRAVVNGSTGAVEQTVAYYPYGAVIADLGTGASVQRFKFGGKELTIHNGLNEYDFGARQYYPAVPHFTSVDPLCENDYPLSPYLYCGNNPVNAIDPTGKVVICLDEQAQRNISMTLTEDESKYVQFVDGKIDADLLNQCESTSDNMTALKTVVNSEINIFVSTATKYLRTDGIRDLKESDNKGGTVGVTMMPDNNTVDVSMDQDVHIFTSNKISAMAQCENIAHELYGHAYFYILNKRGIDVNPLHKLVYIASKGAYLEEFGCFDNVLTPIETNTLLELQINKVVKQAHKNFNNRIR